MNFSTDAVSRTNLLYITICVAQTGEYGNIIYIMRCVGEFTLYITELLSLEFKVFHYLGLPRTDIGNLWIGISVHLILSWNKVNMYLYK